MLESLLVQLVVCSVDDVVEMMIHSLIVLVIRSQPALLAVDTEIVDEYVLVDPHMIDCVSLSFCMDEYCA